MKQTRLFFSINVNAVIVTAIILIFTVKTSNGDGDFILPQLTSAVAGEESSGSSSRKPSGNVVVTSRPAKRPGIPSEKCPKVKCEQPPEKSNCTTVNMDTTTLPQPTGGKAECCPLWVCGEKPNGSFFTFHGVVGQGSETVKYTSGSKNSRTFKQEIKQHTKAHIIRTGTGRPRQHYENVTSEATGNHDSNAFADTGGSKESEEKSGAGAVSDILAEIEKSMKSLGLR